MKINKLTIYFGIHSNRTLIDNKDREFNKFNVEKLLNCVIISHENIYL